MVTRASFGPMPAGDVRSQSASATCINTSQELASQNTAVGIVVGAIFIGLGIAVGLVVGLGLN